MSRIDSSGVVTNYHLSNPNNIWYTTTEIDEIIPFVGHEDNGVYPINDIQVFANATNILYKLCRIDNETDKNILYTSDVICVESGAVDSTVGVSFNAIQILGVIGQVFRFKGNFY